MDGHSPIVGDVSSFSSALVKALGEMQNATLNKENPHFRSKYADLAAIRQVTLPILTQNNLAITQYTKVRDGSLVLVTRLMHSGGEFIEGEYLLPASVDKPQAMGSALTYARRYGWSAMCGITADEDDDANLAQEAGSKPKGNDPRVITEDQATVINDLIKEVDANKDAFLKYFNVQFVSEIPANQYQQAVSALEKKRKKAA